MFLILLRILLKKWLGPLRPNLVIKVHYCSNDTIRACLSTNSSCISTNPKSSSSAFPWLISKKASEDNPAQQLFEAILETQKNVKIENVEHTPTGNTTHCNGLLRIGV
ncbi:hypothetical protein POM88_027945 [Heracleum sosnowskyi]|uniref:Uncharacterized protein n=1 Tax=Heracleum sosnowskyi TaxID=360622 RepID=A0AAD8I8X6_9APIA|nr:hypothetical protein POM88_027945 [Heracleum sosnowskyi]